jgi:type IV secretory pathway VirB10-like protein
VDRGRRCELGGPCPRDACRGGAGQLSALDCTPTGRTRLIPQGARLIGTYDSQVAFGQSRVLLIWTRLIMPNGRSIVLERQPGADAAGHSGLEDEVDNHWKELLGAAALSTLPAVGTEVKSGADVNNSNSGFIQTLRRGAGDSINQTGQQIVRRNLNIQPTLTIRPGFQVRVIVNRGRCSRAGRYARIAASRHRARGLLRPGLCEVCRDF